MNKINRIEYALYNYISYSVEWKTRKASPARKSRDDNRPATGRSWKPVRPSEKMNCSRAIHDQPTMYACQ